ncbi:CHASE domain-containing protein [Paraglaciecola aquimarina]|uniref:histidine kinase n=1 Tax=Paraglaciecola algarum TaxID=3050085 RepID=A0ABS9D3Q0_9ALTE|nr:CHASE domain-containing protein [Paraglaciecola sp. G1-23]MCF2947549.1 CHASE domain-containing protein [Paraglaciecola sp. G1-23]
MKHSIFFKKVLNKSLFRALILPALILIVGSYISYKAEYKEQQIQNALAIQTLKNDLSKISADFEERIRFYTYGLRGLHGLISTIGLKQFDYQTMLTYSRNRDFQQEFPGVRGIGFIQKVEQVKLSSFLQQQKQMRPDNHFTLRQLSAHNQSLFIIRFIEPETFNKNAVGLDIGSETMRRNAAINAAVNNKIEITAPITLVQADKKVKHGFLILLPIYDTSILPNAPAAKLAHVIGWTYAPILIDEVLSANQAFPNNIDVIISDVTDDTRTVFYQPQLTSPADDFIRTMESVPVFGRIWEFTAIATTSYVEDAKTVKPYTVFIQYLILTVVLALGLLSLTLIYFRKEEAQNLRQQFLITNDKMLEESNERLEGLVAKRTKEISDANALKTAILKNASYSVIATDTSGLITLFNPAAERLLGYVANDLILKESPALFHLSSEIETRALKLSEELQCIVKPGFDVFSVKSNKGLEDEWQWTYVAKNGQHIPVMLNVTALKNEFNEITGYLGIAYDLTEQIEKEQALAEAKELAEKANLAKSEFLANMSHEIRTPLNGMFGTLQLLNNETDEARKRELIELAIRSTTTLNKLVNDILDISKLESGKLELDVTEVNLVELTKEIKSELLTSLQAKGLNLSIKNELNHDVWLVDELRLKQVLLNVLSNAIKFTKRGEIILSLDTEDKEGMLISIQDPGIGMSKNAQSRLFQRFEQADKSITRRYGGTGLGMSITQSLVQLMQGKIEVSSIENIGTTINIFLPLQAVKSPLPNLAIHEINTGTLVGKNILIAEDNEINQLVLSSMLENSDATIFIVENGELAVDFIVHNEVDIILMDIQMPVMGGVEACKLIKAKHPELPIIAITANAFEQDIKLYTEVGFNAYVAKPFEKRHLLTTIIATLAD